mgnify:FL=1
MDENNHLNRVLEQERISTEGRLPPGQTLTIKFPVLHYGPVPSFNPSTWNFRIWGEVEEETTWNWEEFNKLPRVQTSMDLHCVTGWSKADTTWEGVSVQALVANGLLKLKPSAAFVMQHAELGYSVNLPLEVVLQENFLLATHYNGEVLTPDHGYPLRGVVGAVPGRNALTTPYLWKGAKWLRGLEFMSSDRPGFWERAGYSNSADVWQEERYA